MTSTKSTKPKDKLGRQSLETEQLGVVKNLTPFEDITHLAGIASISLGGRKNIGALILKKKEDIQIRFCFDIQGIHPSLPEEQILPIFENIEGGLKELPERETLTIHIGSGRVDGRYYPAHLSVRSGRARFRASGSRCTQLSLLLMWM